MSGDNETQDSRKRITERLTARVATAGWASKIGPSALREILDTLPLSRHPDLLVGLDTSDDAGVVRLSDELALIQTVDFFTPIVDDPYDFGRIAAANSLSDVYAMGGTPLTALNIVCFPLGDLPNEVLTEILRGGGDTMRAAGVHLAGGHSVKDKEPKYGLSVTGTAHPQRITTNAGARDSDVLVLTKPIGTGILTTAAKRDALDTETLAVAVETMATLNRGAAQAMQNVGISTSKAVGAATDITGFGLLGHLSHIARASNVILHIESADVPLLPRTLELAAAGFTTGGGDSNATYLVENGLLRFDAGVSEPLRAALVDPQTSGGLCICVRRNDLPALLTELEEQQTPVRAIIGHVKAIGKDGSPHIVVH